MFFGEKDKYWALWTKGDEFVVGLSDLTTTAPVATVTTATAQPTLTFGLDSDNMIAKNDIKLLSGGETYKIAGCSACGHVEFIPNSLIGVCACQDSNDTLYASLTTDFNKLLKAVGFTYAVGATNYSRVLQKDVAGLAMSMNPSASYKFQPSTELAVNAIVDVPQTGSVSYVGFAMIALAVAAAFVAVKKVRA